MKKIVFTLLVAFTVLTACEDNNDSANSSNPAIAFSKIQLSEDSPSALVQKLHRQSNSTVRHPDSMKN